MMIRCTLGALREVDGYSALASGAETGLAGQGVSAWLLLHGIELASIGSKSVLTPKRSRKSDSVRIEPKHFLIDLANLYPFWL